MNASQRVMCLKITCKEIKKKRTQSTIPFVVWDERSSWKIVINIIIEEN